MTKEIKQDLKDLCMWSSIVGISASFVIMGLVYNISLSIVGLIFFGVGAYSTDKIVKKILSEVGQV